MIEPRFDFNAKLGREEASAKLRDQLFHRVGIIAEALDEDADRS